MSEANIFLPLVKIKGVKKIEAYKYFVDEQKIGPYKMRHHQPKIEATEGGVLMTDIVSYQPPLGILGSIANALFIKKQSKHIFDFRSKALDKGPEKYNCTAGKQILIR